MSLTGFFPKIYTLENIFFCLLFCSPPTSFSVLLPALLSYLNDLIIYVIPSLTFSGFSREEHLCSDACDDMF